MSDKDNQETGGRQVARPEDEPMGCEGALRRAGVFKGESGLRDFAEADNFWSRQPYGKRFYYGDGSLEYVHRDVLRAAVRALDEAAIPAKEPDIRHLIEERALRDAHVTAALVGYREGAITWGRAMEIATLTLSREAERLRDQLTLELMTKRSDS